ncbi:NADPH-dependent FMN reductase [Labrenzia sp. PHM005]|uniref:NADPH-dependent FMN reductase n=1 Tax=Labrenzia sp. PHM005 TaxID=2590016 RepID=UPI00114091BB|nr:NAD(P)H-dependent oxidoreductase [Labrenzia sp. PHM005]QDG74674.1 NAD(P)H-dependent oxidoreductase [Labrenzia sp. PHM005]
MKVLAFAATSSRQSINKQLVQAAGDIIKSDLDPSADIEVIDLNDYEMPIYSIDRENEGGIPEEAKRFFDKIGSADAVIVSYAEHNGTYTAAFKNVFDWASRINMKVFQDKPQVALSASMGPGGAASVLNSATGSAGFFGADIRGSLSVGPFGEKFDTEAGKLVDETLNQSLREALAALVEDRTSSEKAA